MRIDRAVGAEVIERLRPLGVEAAIGALEAHRVEKAEMILRQFLHHDPVGISYLFGCGGQASGAVVDPVGDISPYLRASEETGMRIKFVVDTHIHADHLSSGRQLAEATGAAYVLSSRADVAFPFQAVEDNDFFGTMKPWPSRPSCVSRDIVQVELRTKMSTSPDCKAVKRCFPASGMKRTFVGSLKS
jgi:glyoxylase-like metal-dependent hydrolase (beta-lactamase superfamily II)